MLSFATFHLVYLTFIGGVYSVRTLQWSKVSLTFFEKKVIGGMNASICCKYIQYNICVTSKLFDRVCC